MQDVANTAFEGMVARFGAAHPDADTVLFPFNAVQRRFVANFGDLGFVDAVHGCTSGMIIADYAGSNFYTLGNPHITAPAAKVGNCHAPLADLYILLVEFNIISR